MLDELLRLEAVFLVLVEVGFLGEHLGASCHDFVEAVHKKLVIVDECGTMVVTTKSVAVQEVAGSVEGLWVVRATCYQNAAFRFQFAFSMNAVLDCLPTVRIEGLAVFWHVWCRSDIH